MEKAIDTSSTKAIIMQSYKEFSQLESLGYKYPQLSPLCLILNGHLTRVILNSIILENMAREA